MKTPTEIVEDVKAKDDQLKKNDHFDNVYRRFTETAAGSLRIHSDGGMRHSSIPESAPAQGTLISQPCAKVLP